MIAAAGCSTSSPPASSLFDRLALHRWTPQVDEDSLLSRGATPTQAPGELSDRCRYTLEAMMPCPTKKKIYVKRRVFRSVAPNTPLGASRQGMSHTGTHTQRAVKLS